MIHFSRRGSFALVILLSCLTLCLPDPGAEASPPRPQLLEPVQVPRIALIMNRAVLNYVPGMSSQARDQDFLSKLAQVKSLLGLIRPAVAPGTTPPPPQPAPAPPEIAAEMRVGRYISEQQVLARAGEGGVFFRLPHDAPLLAGERLFTPPNFQPQILFVSGVSFRLIGPAMLTTTTIPDYF